MIAVGVDTHKERHYAVALDQVGQLLAERSFAATAAGYVELQRWAERLVHARALVFGLEGAGSWGAGLCQHLQHARYPVLEVERPRRKDRRAGKSDRIDALAAAKCVLSPSLSTWGETLIIEESVNLEGENGDCWDVGDGHEWSRGCG